MLMMKMLKIFFIGEDDDEDVEDFFIGEDDDENFLLEKMMMKIFY